MRESAEDKFPGRGGEAYAVAKKIFESKMFDLAKRGKRVDGRGPSEVRPINIKAPFLPNAHGSAVFTRGETQSVATATLGDKGMELKYDTLWGQKTKKVRVASLGSPPTPSPPLCERGRTFKSSAPLPIESLTRRFALGAPSVLPAVLLPPFVRWRDGASRRRRPQGGGAWKPSREGAGEGHPRRLPLHCQGGKVRAGLARGFLFFHEGQSPRRRK